MNVYAAAFDLCTVTVQCQGAGHKRASDPPKLELYAIVSYLMWVLVTKL